MAKIMENDMNDPAPLSRESFDELLDLSQYAFNRLDAERWAYKGIKFLVYDNTDSDAGYEGNDSDGMLGLAKELSLRKQYDADGMLKLSKSLSLPDHDDPDGELELAKNLSLQQQSDLGGMLELAKKRSLLEQSDGQITASGGDAIAEKDSHDGASTDDSRDKPCPICSHIPEFPLQKAHKFRLFRPQDLPISSDDTFSACNHYAAISYCWPVPKKDEAGNIIEPLRTYQVRDVDGTVRTNRTLDDILDRAVSFALSTGVRMIWIDQECLPQPKDGSSVEEWKEQDLGVQAMDVVYARAAATGGLLNAEITEQVQVHALTGLMNYRITSGHGNNKSEIVWRGTGPASPFDGNLLGEAISFFRMICEDRYYTRAWVVQEGISAGSKLALVFRKAATISHMQNMGEWVKSNNARDTYAYADHARKEQQEKSGVICIPIQDFQQAINVASYLLERASLRMRVSGKDTVSSGWSTARDIVQRAAGLHPDVPETPLRKLHYYADKGVMQTGELSAVDAAGAWTLLQSRSCRDPQDFLAIMANMCGFDRRLDVTKVARRCKSLRAALVALSLNNGDYSVLVPEGFAGDIQGKAQPTSSPHWLFPLCDSSRRMEHLQMRPGSFGSGDIQGQRRITEDGLSLQAYSWTVDSVYEFKSVQTEYAQTWDDLKYLGRSFARLESETEEAYNARQNSSIEGIANRKALDTLARNNSDLRKILRHMDELIITSPDNQQAVASLASMMDDPSSARDLLQWTTDMYAKEVSSSKEFREGSYRVRLGITRYRVEHLPEMRKTIAEIIIAILRFLYEEDNIWATGLGNSIWHSIRRGAVHDSDKGPDIPDLIGPWLYDHPLILEGPWSLFEFDDYPGESDEYSQLWFVERIMRDGFLWVGRYDRMPGSYSRHEANVTGNPMLFLTQPEVFQEYGEQRMNPMMSSKGKSTPQAYDVHRKFMTNPLDDPDVDLGSEFEQWSKQEENKRNLDMLMDMEDGPFSTFHGRSHLRMARDGPDSTERELTLQLFYFLSETDGIPHIFLETMARFYGGNAFVNMVDIERRELWTRAADYHRHNSLISAFDVDGPCKVVIPYDGNLERPTHAKLRSMSVCWVVEGENGLEDGEDQGNKDTTGSCKEKHAQLNQGTHKTYRVLSKVRGLWQLMDYPRQHYTFSWK